MGNKKELYGKIGLWWYTDARQVWAKTWNMDDGYVSGAYYKVPACHNHCIDWVDVVHLNMKGDKDRYHTIELGYKYYERGLMTYNFVTQKYSLTCSEELSHDIDAIKDICEFFDVLYKNTAVVAIPDYRRYIKTGDPDIDSMQYGFLP